MAGNGGTFNGSVAIVNTTAAAVSGWISNFSQPSGFAYDGIGAKVFVSDFTPCCPAYVQVANATRGSSSQNISMGGLNPEAITFDPDNENLYVNGGYGQGVMVINGSSNTVVLNITGPSLSNGSPVASVYDPANHRLYVPVQGANNDVALIDTVNQSLVGSIPLPSGVTPIGAAIDSARGWLFVAGQGGCVPCAGSVVVINTTSNGVVASIPLSFPPTSLAFDSSNREVYVTGSTSYANYTNPATGVVTVINTTSDSVVGEVGAGQSPDSILYDPSNTNLYVADPGSGTLIVIPSTLAATPVTVNEVGLPNGTVWYVNLTDGEVYSSASSSLTFFETNGSYAFSVASWDGTYTAPGGGFGVSGSPVTINITFVENPNVVTFQEVGLPANTYWSVYLYGSPLGNNTTTYFQDKNTTQGTLSFIVPNGRYQFYVFSAYSNGTTYSPVLPNGTVNETGVPVTINVTFVPLCTVQFNETGLPFYYTWQVTFNGSQGSGWNGAPITFNVPAGTYTFSVPSVSGYGASPSSGSITVTNRTVYVTINFAFVTYPVTFAETGLPAGTSWGVLTQHGFNNTTSESETFNFSNGSFLFLVWTVPGYLVTPSFGVFNVTGGPLLVNVTFEPLLYNVTFSESGLPVGTPWSVSVGDLTVNATTSSVTFALPNGSFAFTTTAGPSYTTNPSRGELTVSGASTTEAITFQAIPVYPVTFSENGLGAGQPWSVALDNYTEGSTGGALEFAVPNGTYSFTVTAQDGFLVTPTNGSFEVNGGAVSVSINFTAASPVKAPETFIGLPATEGYALVGTIAGLLVGTAIGLALRRRRGPPPVAATQPWAEGPPPQQGT